MYLLYNLIFLIIIIIYTPFLVYNILKGKYHKDWKERFGFLSRDLISKFRNNKTIWIHAASVGETVAANLIVEGIKDQYPEYKVLFSTWTETGRKMAEKIVKKADGIIYLPLDFIWIVRRVLRLIRPNLIIMIETELWPNLLKEAKRLDSRVMIVSGRISDKSIRRYRYLGPILKDMLANVDIFSMQSEQDCKRIISLGAEEKKVYKNGNIKYDQDYNRDDCESVENIYREFKLAKNQPILVMGSTHDNEEERLITVYQKLKAEFPDIVMFLAPRYIERAEEIGRLYHKAGISTIRRTEIDKRNPALDSVIIIDTIGELAYLYQLADLVFVGGSLIERGGHNILEPAAQGKLVFFGSHMFNFKEDTNYLLKHQAAIQVTDEGELADMLLYFLHNRDKLAKKGRLARKLIEVNKGSVNRNLKLVGKLLKYRILLVRLSAIGDVIHALPVARAVRESYPGADLSWLVERKSMDMVAGNPNLDRIIVMPRDEWESKFKENKLKAIKEARKFFKELKGYDFDLVLDLHGIFKSALPTYFTGSNKRYGPANGREGSTLFYNYKIKLPRKLMHVIDKNLYLSKAIGTKVKKVNFDIVISDEEEEKVDNILNELSLKDRKIIVINPFTSWSSKNWLKKRYAQLADKLIRELNFEIIFTGGSGDKMGVEEILSMMKENAHNLVGRTNLKELAGLYQRATLFIGGDTGPMHLAVAMGIPTVVIMGPTNPVTHGPYGEGHIVFQADLPCKNCWQRKCPKNHECMKEITVEQVFTAVNNVLK